MEDSYTVHRRRKAAARRREKTPEPRLAASISSLHDKEHLTGEETNSMDEEEERRARMERMVEDTERMELMINEERSRSRSPAVNRADEARKAGSPAKSREQPEEPSPSQPPVKTTRRVRSESNEGTELRKRMGSPEAAKTRSSSTRRDQAQSLEPDDQSDSTRVKKRASSSTRQRYQPPSEDDEAPIPAPIRQRSPRSPVKKQIIPLSNESLIEDVAKAKRAYANREPIDDYEYEDEDEDEEEEEELIPRRKRDTTLRKRKTSVMHTDSEKEEISKTLTQGPSSWFSWIPFFGRSKEKVEDEKTPDDEKKKEKEDEKPPAAEEEKPTPAAPEKPESDKATIGEFFSSLMAIAAEFREFCRQNPTEVQALIELRNLCIVETIITIIVCGLGGFAFRFTEGAFESFYKCGVKRVKRDFLDSLWTFSHNLKEDDWKSLARRKLYEFEEQLHEAHEAGVQSYSGQKSWTFLNSMVYSLTIISTIGYGHISPSTTTGRALTIVYAIIGIPMFLIVLADFGKLFTRGIKFLWAFVRRLYYTGSCRKVRRTVQVQEMMKGVQLVYDLATFRRPSQLSPEELEEIQRQQKQQATLGMDSQQQPESPSTPAMSTFEIDDEFNLPISVAIAILVLYIIVGAAVFNFFEEWTFFESFYFVFISMSTIGFGDFVPKDPVYMMLSIVYMIFGLALTSMCINVVQVMLTDQFKQASQKIGASIGFHVSEEDGSLKPAPPAPVEIAEVHISASETKEKIAPKAKQEDDEL